MDRKFLIKKISENSLEQELTDINFDLSYLSTAKNKYESSVFKIFNLTPVQATILKQTALSAGTDCAVNKNVLTQSIEYSDAILFATNSQLKLIIDKLKRQPFNLKNLAENIERFAFNKLNLVTIKNTVFDWRKTYLMGILNYTPNSFSDNGEFFRKEAALDKFNMLIENGADIIDIGAESTAPQNQPVEVGEEIKRLKEILPVCRDKNNNIPISVDTRNSLTAQYAINSGADIINDVSGCCHDENMVDIIASSNSYIILTFDDKTDSTNIIDATIKGLISRVKKLSQAGLDGDKIILDVGLGFNKTYEQNFELIKRANEICSIGFPVLYGLSRKSFIQKVTGLSPKSTTCANISLASYLAAKGVNIIRAHDIYEHKIAFNALDKVLYD